MSKATDPAIAIQVTEKGQIIIEVACFNPATQSFEKLNYPMTIERSLSVAKEVFHFQGKK